MTGQAHHNDPETSHISARRTKTAELKEILYGLIEERPRAAFQLRDYYAANAMTQGWPDVKADSVNKRISELHRAGWVEPHPTKRVTTEFGRPAVVWRITEPEKSEK